MLSFKIYAKNLKEERLASHRDTIYKVKQERLQNKINQFGNMLDRRKHMALHLKRKKTECQQKRLEEQSSEMEMKALKVQELKRGEILRRQRMQRYREQKILMTKKEYLEKFRNTEETRKQREKEVMQMEVLESEMMKKIDETQQIQKTVFD